MAEESTNCSGVTRPPKQAALGFTVQVELGWMHIYAGLHEAGPGVPPVSSRQADLWCVVQPYRKLFCRCRTMRWFMAEIPFSIVCRAMRGKNLLNLRLLWLDVWAFPGKRNCQHGE